MTTTAPQLYIPDPTPGWGLVFDLDISLIGGKPPLNANDRHHGQAKGRLTRRVRNSIAAECHDQAVPLAGYVVAQLHFIPPTNGRRDPANLTATSKPAIDGLVQAHVIPDDEPLHLREIMPMIHKREMGQPRLWLRVWLYPERPAAEDLHHRPPAEPGRDHTARIPHEHREPLVDILSTHEDRCRAQIADAIREERDLGPQALAVLHQVIQVCEGLRLQLTAPQPPAAPAPGSLEEILSCEAPDYRHDQGLTSIEYGRICRRCRVREPHHA